MVARKAARGDFGPDEIGCCNTSPDMGCAIMPEFLPLLPGIATRVLTGPEVSRTISPVTLAGGRFSPAVQVFVRHAQQLGSQQTTTRTAPL